jgi:cellobiose-specific phosphotransferase system component IIC
VAFILFLEILAVMVYLVLSMKLMGTKARVCVCVCVCVCICVCVCGGGGSRGVVAETCHLALKALVLWP